MRPRGYSWRNSNPSGIQSIGVSEPETRVLTQDDLLTIWKPRTVMSLKVTKTVRATSQQRQYPGRLVAGVPTGEFEYEKLGFVGGNIRELRIKERIRDR